MQRIPKDLASILGAFELPGGEPLDSWTVEKRKKRAVMIQNLFHHWNLTLKDRTKLLGLSKEEYHQDEPLPDRPETLIRSSYLLGMHGCLRLLYPSMTNRDMVYAWVTTPNRQFGRTPLAVMNEKGLNGIAEVSGYLWGYLYL
jgi:hypothetical protein